MVRKVCQLNASRSVDHGRGLRTPFIPRTDQVATNTQRNHPNGMTPLQFGALWEKGVTSPIAVWGVEPKLMSDAFPDWSWVKNDMNQITLRIIQYLKILFNLVSACRFNLFYLCWNAIKLRHCPFISSQAPKTLWEHELHVCSKTCKLYFPKFLPPLFNTTEWVCTLYTCPGFYQWR